MGKVKIENGIIIGTSGNKFATKNPLAIYLLKGFDNAIVQMVRFSSPTNVLEVGCGEGHVTKLILENSNARILATDISQSIIDQTRKDLNDTRVTYQVGPLETLTCEGHFDLVVCCEVLEHLYDPNVGLDRLRSFNADWYLLSVPREPIWRAMNMARGTYLSQWGNSPGHIQHWSKRSFLRLVSRYFEIVQVKSPLPWTVLLCRPYR
jgi:2-polyprenyl-3-methyl-5-hydroxy-6-metoxy-1,4-benzoquinol methylase